MDSFIISSTFPASAEEIYNAWLSSQGHSQMTGSPAEVNAGEDENFKAWDGYIWGRTLETHPPQRIVQAWRTSEFPEDSPDSRLEIQLKESDGETTVTLIHSEIPDGQGENYKQGWEDFYFSPMQKYFSK